MNAIQTWALLISFGLILLVGAGKADHLLDRLMDSLSRNDKDVSGR